MYRKAGCLKVVAVLVVSICSYVFISNRTSPFTFGFPFPVRMCIERILKAENVKFHQNEQHWLDVLKNEMPRSFLRPDFGKGESYLLGQTLPAVFYDPDRLNGMFYVELSLNLSDGRLVVHGLREYWAFFRMQHALEELSGMGSLRLMDWLLENGDTLPPRRLDTLVCLELSTTGCFHECPREFWSASHEKWLRMSSAKNAVYRLLAIDRERTWTVDTTESLELCTRALRETNSLFHYHAIGKMSGIASDLEQGTQYWQRLANEASRAGRDASAPRAKAIREVIDPVERILREYLNAGIPEDATIDKYRDLKGMAREALATLADVKAYAETFLTEEMKKGD